MAKKRKTLTKKVRFEVFKRDGFQCAYCGRTPPDVQLEVDHIDPVSNGGEDDMNNYITACFDCNRGKTNIPLDKIPAQLSENFEALQQKEIQLREYRKYVKSVKQRETRDINSVAKIFSVEFDGYSLKDKFKRNTIKLFLSKLPKHEVEESMEKAVDTVCDPEGAAKYFCGICWNKIREKEEA